MVTFSYISYRLESSQTTTLIVKKRKVLPEP